MPDATDAPDNSNQGQSEDPDLPSRKRWERVENLFHQASGFPLAQRGPYLDRQCGDDPSLKQEVLGLLGSDSSVSDLMAAPLLVTGDHLSREPVSDHCIGRVLNGFRIEALLGRGGMGVVYLGARVDGILSQQVAIKLMAQHLQSSPAQIQFQLERDALATLEHPHIAKLVGGGVTQERLPFVVMEYVQGKRLDIACDEPGVSLEQIVRWMMQLSDAVSYVHRNLILHRDLKPGNVMVTASGDVKLLDFGTLKAIGSNAVANSAMTQAGMRPVTLRYASPEHIRGEAGSTALDIYSLGMTLYRLIAEGFPEGFNDLSIPEYLNRLEHGELPPPSSLMSAARKKSDPALAADLDAITLKATRYAALDRYQDADALRADLRRALERKPVLARAGTIQYRTGRFLQRHRSSVAAMVVAVVMISIALVSMSRQTAVARDEKHRADAAIIEETKLTHFLLFDYFEELKRIPSSTEAQRKAVSLALHYLDTSSQQSLTPALRLDTVQAYTEMGSLQGSPYEENLGDVPSAIATLQKGVYLAETLLATNPHDTKFLQSAVGSELALGRVYFGSGDPKRAAQYLVPAADASRRIATLPATTVPELAQAASVVDALGDVYGQEGAVTLNDPDNAIVRYQQAQEMDARGLRKDPACARCRRGVALEDWKIGMLVQDEGQSKKLFEAGLATLAVFSPTEQQTVRVMRMDTVLRQRIAIADIHDGDAANGLAMLDLVKQRFQNSVSADPTDARARYDLAALDFSRSEGYDELGRFSDEEQAYREFFENMDALMKQDPGNHAWTFALAQGRLRDATLMMKTGRQSEGNSVRDKSLKVLVPLAQREDADANLLSITAAALADRQENPSRDAPLAIAFAQRAVATSPHPSVDELLALAESQRFGGLIPASREIARKALELQRIHPAAEGSAAHLKQIYKLLSQ